MLYLSEFFREGGVPSYVITSNDVIDEKEAARIKLRMKELYGRRGGVPGNTGWHEWAVIGNGGKIEPLGITPDKLDMSRVFDVTESRACAVLSVPAILVGVRIGLLQAQAYGTAREAKRGWWGKDLIPFLSRLAQLHTLKIAGQESGGAGFFYDVRRVAAVREAMSPIMRDAGYLFALNVLSRDQALEHAGYQPVDGHPVYSWELRAAQAASGRVPSDELSRPDLPELPYQRAA